MRECREYISNQIDENLCSRFRVAMRGVASTVSIITSSDEFGNFYGMISTTFTAVAVNPPIALVCVNKKASILPIIQTRKVFYVNILTERNEKLCDAFSRSEMRQLRFAEGNWKAGEEGAPYLDDAQASIFCGLKEYIVQGTHVIIVASVLEVCSSSKKSPLLYLEGKYRYIDR